MAITETLADGRTRIIEDGRWRDATQAEVEILQQGAFEATARASGQSFRGLRGVLNALGGSVAGAEAGFAADVETMQLIQQAGQAQTQGGLQEIAESGQAIEDLEFLRPGPAFAGQLLTEGLIELATGGFGVKALAGRGVRRGVREAAEEGIERAARSVPVPAAGIAENIITPEDATQLGGVLKSSGGDLGAASSKGILAALGRSPTMRAILEKFEDIIGSSRQAVTPDQQTLIDTGAAERLGFQFLPGQKEGNNTITELVKSQPFLADSLDPIITANAKRGGDLIREALGLPPGPLTRDTFREADEVFAREFENFSRELRPAALPDELRKAIDSPDMLTTKDRRVFRVTEPGEKISGERLLNLRSKLNRSLASARRGDQGVLADEILEQMDALDLVIKANIEGGAKGAAWGRFMDTRQRWRVNLAFNRPGSFMPDGNFSVKRFSSSLERTFEREYRKRLLQRNEAGEVIDAQMPEQVADLLDFMRLGRTFESNLGDSGTASRLAMAELFKPGGGRNLIKQRMAAKFITDVLLNQPARAADLP